jgi:hypothetical protein
MRFSAEVVMETAYLICALVGGTLVVCQFLLTLLGLGGHHDTGGGHDLAGHDSAHDHHGESGAASWFFSVLTFRTVTAGAALFGLTGLFLGTLELGQPVTLGCAILAGLAALFAVSSLMRSMAQLNVDGTLHIRRAVGATGNVYLSIPANNAGLGKVHVTVGGRLLEYKAVSRADDLPTGVPIVVVGVVDADTVEVTPAPVSERVHHE